MWRVIAICLLIAVGSVLCFAASIVNVKLVNAVNNKLPPDAQFAMFGWWAGKKLRLRYAYKRLYPTKTLLRQADVLTALAMFCVAAAAALLFRWI
jgi:hypothetical protein